MVLKGRQDIGLLMPDLWLGDVGIRVTDLKRSLEFYTKVLGPVEIEREEMKTAPSCS